MDFTQLTRYLPQSGLKFDFSCFSLLRRVGPTQIGWSLRGVGGLLLRTKIHLVDSSDLETVDHPSEAFSFGLYNTILYHLDRA